LCRTANVNVTVTPEDVYPSHQWSGHPGVAINSP